MPRSPLLPYTTLFRSRALGRKSAISRARGALRDLSDDDRKVAGQLVNDVHRAIEETLDAKRVAIESVELGRRWESERIDVTLDRKSTRLNSSHLVISYAPVATPSLHDALPISRARKEVRDLAGARSAA